MLKKLRSKFIWITMCIVTAMLLVIFTLVYQLTARNLNEQADGMLRNLAQSATKPTTIYEKQEVGLPYILIQISPRGEVIASGVTGYDVTDQSFLAELIRSVYSQDRTQGDISQYSLRYYRIYDRGTEYIAMVDISSQQQTLRSLIYTSMGIGIACILAFLVISFLLARWAIRPVEHAWQAQKQFVSDASHELKTPLTVIMSNAELLQETRDIDESKRYGQNIQVMAMQMRSLTQGLLELARVDNGQVKKNFAQLDFSRLVTDALLPFEPAFFEQGLQLECSVIPDISLMGSEQYLQQVVDILLDNALKYSDQGIVEVKLQLTGRNQCLLSVSNPGMPIAAQEQEKIFERFYRSDKARTRTGSFGLGLAIAKSIVEDHNGKIWVQSNQTGNCFYVLLPIN